MRKKSIIIPIVLLAIGFAAVSTTLILNGNIGVGTNRGNLVDGVVFDEDSLRTSNNNIIAEVSESGRTISFTTQEMTNVNDTSTVYFKIKNYSQYNATLGTPAITCYFVSEYEVDTKADSIGTTHEYMELIPGTELNGDTIAAGGNLSEESSITVKQIKSSIETTTQEVKFQCVINATGEDSDTPSAEKVPTYTVNFNANGGNIINDTKKVIFGEEYGELPIPTKEGFLFAGWYTSIKSSGVEVESTSIVNIKENHTLIAMWEKLMPAGYYLIDNDNNNTADIGEKIRVGTESFYVISHTNGELNALAKYNLNVGSNTVPNATYGIQHKDARGYIKSGPNYGNVVFSKNCEWVYENLTKIDIRNETYRVGNSVTVETMTALDALYSSNESVGIKGYEKYIKETIRTAEVRLITKGELEGLGCSGSCVSTYKWIYTTSYWTQTIDSIETDYLLNVLEDGRFGFYPFDYDNGVRPVIEIPA